MTGDDGKQLLGDDHHQAPDPDQYRGRKELTAHLVEQLAACLADGGDLEEEHRLRQELVVANVPVATNIAARYRRRTDAFEDLVQAANLGLVKAANNFTPGMAPDFLAYAVPTISGEVKRYFRDQSWAIRPPRRVQEMRPDVHRAAEDLTQELGHSPTMRQIADRLEVSEEDVIEALASVEVFHVHSLDAPASQNADGMTVADTVEGADDRLDLFDDLASLRPLLAELPPRERRILALRFFHEQTQQQIANQVGVTQMQVSRILTKTLSHLKTGLAASMEDETDI